MDNLWTLLNQLDQRWILGLLIFLSVGVLAILVHAYLSGRKIKFWMLEIEAQPETKSTKSTQKKEIAHLDKADTILEDTIPRISIMASTTYEIERSREKTEALKLFYRSLLSEIKRSNFGINFCGAQPFREILFEDYYPKLLTHSKTQMKEVDRTVRWYWHARDNVGLNYEPAFYESYEAESPQERTIREVSDADIVLAFTGRTGTRRIIEELIRYHNQELHDINLKSKPLILLGWFGGSVKEHIDENLNTLDWLLSNYSELDPVAEISKWYEGDQPTKLAQKLAKTIRRLLLEKSANI